MYKYQNYNQNFRQLTGIYQAQEQVVARQREFQSVMFILLFGTNLETETIFHSIVQCVLDLHELSIQFIKFK